MLARRSWVSFAAAVAFAGALLWAALGGAPARALDAEKPVPTCAGLAFSDPVGDQVFAVPVAGGLTAGPDNTDVKGGFFKFVDDVLTANIQITNLNQSIPTGATGVGWYFVWIDGTNENYVQANVDITGALSYAYGVIDPATGVYTDAGPTTGKLFEGPDGVIQLTVPANMGGAEGKVLKSPHVVVFDEYNVPMVGGALGTADTGPDGGKGATFAVAPCAEDSGGGGGAAPGTTPAPAALGVTASPRSVSAKKASKKKAIAFTLKAKEPVTRVGIRLFSGSSANPRVVSTASVSKLSGTRKVRLKLRRKLKAGSYTLEIVGTNAAGARATARVKIKVKK